MQFHILDMCSPVHPHPAIRRSYEGRLIDQTPQSLEDTEHRGTERMHILHCLVQRNVFPEVQI